jgi:hypothetical protein
LGCEECNAPYFSPIFPARDCPGLQLSFAKVL